MKIIVATQVNEQLLKALNHLIPQLTPFGAPITKESISSIIDSEDTELLLAFNDAGDIVGTLTLVIFTIPTGKKSFIEDVVVDASAQGLGAGRRLIETAIELAKREKVAKIELSSNPTRVAANSLYQKMGFEIRDTNFYRLQL